MARPGSESLSQLAEDRGVEAWLHRSGGFGALPSRLQLVPSQGVNSPSPTGWRPGGASGRARMGFLEEGTRRRPSILVRENGWHSEPGAQGGLWAAVGSLFGARSGKAPSFSSGSVFHVCTLRVTERRGARVVREGEPAQGTGSLLRVGGEGPAWAWRAGSRGDGGPEPGCAQPPLLESR